MPIKINGTNTAANPSITGDDTDTGIVYGSDRLDFSTGGSSKVTLNGSNLGIGTTTPTGKIHANAAENTATFLAEGEIDNPSYPSYGFSGQNADNGSRGAGMYLPADSTLAFSTAGTEKVRIQSLGGISFNGDTATANALDDYEEGTWTPSYPNGGSITTLIVAKYAKVGRIVNIALYINGSTITNNTSEFRIGGLPYVSKDGYGFGQISYAAVFNVDVWRPLFALNGSYIYFHRVDGSGATLKNNAAPTIILLGGSYFSET